MRLPHRARARQVLLAFACCVAACKGGGGQDEEEFPECDTDAEANFDDGIGLGFVSVDALRNHLMGETRYDIIVHGDDPAVTQFTIGFAGMPVEGMEYELTEELVEEQPILEVYPQMSAPDFIAGTMTFTQVGTENGDILMFDLRIELATGVLQGCIRTTLNASTDGSPDGDTTGGNTGDSTG
jgi:hypothetical protein